MMRHKTKTSIKKRRKIAGAVQPLFVSIAQARKILGVGRTLMYDIINAKMVETVKINNRHLCSTQSIEALADKILKEGSIDIPSKDNLEKNDG